MIDKFIGLSVYWCVFWLICSQYCCVLTFVYIFTTVFRSSLWVQWVQSYRILCPKTSPFQTPVSLTMTSFTLSWNIRFVTGQPLIHRLLFGSCAKQKWVCSEPVVVCPPSSVVNFNIAFSWRLLKQQTSNLAQDTLWQYLSKHTSLSDLLQTSEIFLFTYTHTYKHGISRQIHVLQQR